MRSNLNNKLIIFNNELNSSMFNSKNLIEITKIKQSIYGGYEFSELNFTLDNEFPDTIE